MVDMLCYSFLLFAILFSLFELKENQKIQNVILDSVTSRISSKKFEEQKRKENPFKILFYMFSQTLTNINKN